MDAAINPGLLRGNTVRLTTIREDDIQRLLSWHWDADFLRLQNAKAAKPPTEAQLRKFVQSMQESENNFTFAIRPLDTDEILGFVELDSILWNQGVTGLGIGIGDPSNRGKGYGTEAIRLALRFAFDELNLRRVQLTVFSYNKPAISLYEKLGFKLEGTYREFLNRDGGVHNMLLYGILKHEWEAINKPVVP